MFPLTRESYEHLWHCGPFNIPGYPFFPLLTAGAPAPGPSFVHHARQLGDEYLVPTTKRGAPVVLQAGPRLSQLYFHALYDGDFSMPIVTGSKALHAKMLPGKLYSSERFGPCRAPVMIIGKNPSREEIASGKNFDDAKNEHFWRACDEVGIPYEHQAEWYMTNLMKFSYPDPNKASAPNSWTVDCLPILWQELQIVQPQYILCLGSDASKALTKMCPGAFGGREGIGVEAMRGRVEQLVIPKAGCPGEYITSQVMALVSPANVHRTPELMDTLRDGVRDFWSLTCGQQIGGVETDIDHRVIRDVDTLRSLVDEILRSTNPADSILAVDAEWNGQKPWDPGAYLRTVQFSHKPKFAACVEICGPGGREVFQPNTEAASAELARLMLHPKMRIGGHFLRADIPQIQQHLGIDLRPKYAPAETWELVCQEGGWDTSLMENAVNETGLLGLEVLRAKYTRAPAYEKLLNKWLAAYCKRLGIEKKDIEGFGDWDGDDFYHYACYDADVTRRIAGRLFDTIQHDRFGHDCRKSYHLTHRASLPVLEMEQFGINADPERAELLAGLFSAARGKLVEAIRNTVNWQDFNPNSDQQCRALLFGEEYARKEAPPGCPTVRVQVGETAAQAAKRAMAEVKAGNLAPPQEDQQYWIIFVPLGVHLQNLRPLISTGKRGIAWEKLEAKGETENHKPATSRETLGILSYTNPVAAMLRDIRFLTKALQTVLRRPEIDPDTGTYMKDDDGDFVYDKGLLSHVSSDGKIHTRISQNKETGRSSSSNPPLQNLSKQREDDFKRILGWIEDGKQMGDYLELLGTPQYKYVQRSIFKAPPGHIFMESDYSGAEVAALMWMAQDPQGTDDVRRMFLKESDPDFLDIHSTMAVNAFRLDCAPTKKGLKSIGKPGLRVAAKNVVFGVPYQRGAEAIARQCREKGVNASIEEAQGLIDYYLTRYAVVAQYLEMCKARTRNPMWIRGAFGRYRRFNWTDDRQVQGEQERQACNVSIQNLVADAVWTALYNMWHYREENPEFNFKFVLQIHDAILTAVPFEVVPQMSRVIFQKCMTDDVHVRPCNLDGIPYPDSPVYHMGGEQELMFRWGEDVDDVISEHVDPAAPKLKKLLEDPANDREVVRLLAAAEQFS